MSVSLADLQAQGLKFTPANLFTYLGQIDANRTHWGGTSGGTANAQTLTPDPAWTVLAAGNRVSFIAGASTTAAATMNVSGLGAKTIKTVTGYDLDDGDIVSGNLYELVYDGTNFVITTQLPPLRDTATATGNTVASTTSGTDTDLTDMSVNVNVTTDDIVEVSFYASFSTSLADTTTAIFNVYQAGTEVTDSGFAVQDEVSTETTGHAHNISLVKLIESPSTTGLVTYKINWRRSSGSGTLYCDERRLNVKVYRN
jgi:hypothetical protein